MCGLLTLVLWAKEEWQLVPPLNARDTGHCVLFYAAWGLCFPIRQRDRRLPWLVGLLEAPQVHTHILTSSAGLQVRMSVEISVFRSLCGAPVSGNEHTC